MHFKALIKSEDLNTHGASTENILWKLDVQFS